MKKTITFLFVLLLTLTLRGEVKAAQEYDFYCNTFDKDGSAYNDSVSNLTAGELLYINFTVREQNDGVFHLKMYQQESVSEVAAAPIKVTLQKKTTDNWSDVTQFSLEKSSALKGYLGTLELYLTSGQYRLSLLPTAETVKMKYYMGAGTALGNVKSQAAKLSSRYLTWIQYQAKRTMLMKKGQWAEVSPLTKDCQWAAFSVKKTRTMVLGLQSDTMSGKVRCTIYNQKGKKVYRKTFSEKTKFGVVVKRKLKKGKYYIKIEKASSNAIAHVRVGIRKKWAGVYKSSLKKILQKEGSDMDEDIENYYMDDWTKDAIFQHDNSLTRKGA